MAGRSWTLPSARSRLVVGLDARWRTPVTLITAGPGYGKTTLLEHARLDSRRLRRGEEICVTIHAGDSADDVFEEIARQFAVPIGADGELGEQLAGRAPAHVCVQIDDAHLLNETDIERLVSFAETLPANGHLVVASRSLDWPAPIRTCLTHRVACVWIPAPAGAENHTQTGQGAVAADG